MGSSGSPTVLGADWWLALRTPARGKSDVVGPKPRTLQVRLRSAGTAATPLHGLRRSANLLARWRSLWSAWSAEISHRLRLCCPRYLYVQQEGGPEMAVIRFGWPPACVACKTLVRSAEQYQAPSDILGKAQRGAPCLTRMPRGLRVGRLSVGPPHSLHRAPSSSICWPTSSTAWRGRCLSLQTAVPDRPRTTWAAMHCMVVSELLYNVARAEPSAFAFLFHHVLSVNSHRSTSTSVGPPSSCWSYN